MDRRTFIGISLISVIVILVLLWSGNSQKKNAPAKAQYEQKIDSAKTAAQEITEEATVVITTQQDSLSPLFPAMNGTEQITTLDNGLVKIGISSKGAAPALPN